MNNCRIITFFHCLCAVFTAALLAGCYHFGSPDHAAARLGKLEIQNKTREPSISTQLAGAIREHICITPGATLMNSDDSKNTLDIHIEVSELRNRSIARAELRDSESREDDSDGYQTVLYRITLVAHVIVIPPNSDRPVIDRIYKGNGDLPKMHDREIPLQHAIGQAADDIAAQIANDITTLSR